MHFKRNNILDHVGGTPLIPIANFSFNRKVEILAKVESFNPGGSVKDRPALFMIEDAETRGELRQDKIILEATSGNTGIGLSLIAAVKGYRILLVMSESVSEERKKILKAMGADLKFTPSHLGTDGAIEFAYALAREEPSRYWLADQFNNEANWKSHYFGTAMEIWEQTEGRVDMVVASMGTTGTVMGLARRFKEIKPQVQVVGVEPYMGHKIQGLKNMKESYPPGIFERKRIDRIINMEDEEAFHTARMLAKKEGLLVGMSAGAAMAGALRLSKEMKQGRIVVVLPDGGERYLSTPLFVSRKESGVTLYNTLTRKKDPFIPIKEGHVSMYTCGPTLCQFLHIGQARRLVFSDLMRRYFEFRGFQVTHTINVTDLDDRTIQGAQKAGIPLKDFTENYFREFQNDLSVLNVSRATQFAKASDYVYEMIDLTSRLIANGFAYEKFRSIYFDISRFKDYGKLSRIDLDKIHVGKTVDLEQYEKGNPRDFTLFKRATLSELKKGIFYQTPWGNARPSWHLECPAMALKLLGDTHDIHTGGSDLVFPHHENAIAIGQAATGRPFANYWVHNELVMVEGKKASGDVDHGHYTIRSLLEKEYTGREIRLWLISHRYNKPISFTVEKLVAARNAVHHLDEFLRRLHFCRAGESHPAMDQLEYNLRHGFIEAMNDDFNTSKALAAVFDFTRELNRILSVKGLSETDKQKALEALRGIDSVLGVMDVAAPQGDEKIEALISERERARKEKNWTEADRIRKQLGQMGIAITDTRHGTIWH